MNDCDYCGRMCEGAHDQDEIQERAIPEWERELDKIWWDLSLGYRKTSADKILVDAWNGKRKQVKEFIRSTLINQEVNQERELWEQVEALKCDERKAKVFGKRMDGWEARTYDEKALVNAALTDVQNIIKQLHPQE